MQGKIKDKRSILGSEIRTNGLTTAQLNLDDLEAQSIKFKLPLWFPIFDRSGTWNRERRHTVYLIINSAFGII